MNSKNIKVVLAGTICTGIFCYYRLLIRMYHMWIRDSRMDYLPFVILLAGLLAKTRYDKAVKYNVPVKGSWVGMPILFVGLACDVIGIQMSILSLSVISVIISIGGSIILIMGFRWFRYFFIPLLLLFFLLPVPYYIESTFGTPLRLIATKMAVFILTATGYSIDAMGNIIILPGNEELLIDTACSGIRTLTALLASTIFISAFLKKWKDRFLLLVLAAVTAVVTNAARVSCLALLVMSEGKGLLDTAVHEMTGMLTFIAAMVLIFTFGRCIDGHTTSTPVT